MRTLSEIYQANRARSIALEQALAQAQQQIAASRAEGVKNFLVRRFGNEVLTAEVIARLGQMSPEELDDLLFQSASWQSGSQIESYFDRGGD